MKKILFIVIMLAAMCAAHGQVTFFKFKLTNGIEVKEVKTLEVGAKVDPSVGDLKYLRVEWYAVNQVGDVVSSHTKAYTNEKTGYLLNRASMVGPVPCGKKRFSYFKGAFIINYNVNPMPDRITMTKMDDTEIVIDITKENYKQYFPKLKWVDFKKPKE